MGIVEVLARVICRLAAGIIKVVEHEVHIICLLNLQVIIDLHVAVHFNLNVGVGLPGQSTRLREVTWLS